MLLSPGDRGLVLLLLVTGGVSDRHHGSGAEHDADPLPGVTGGWGVLLVDDMEGRGVHHHASTVRGLEYGGRGRGLGEGGHVGARVVAAYCEGEGLGRQGGRGGGVGREVQVGSEVVDVDVLSRGGDWKGRDVRERLRPSSR